MTASEAPVVQVWGARTRGLKGVFGVHSWIAVKPGGATEYTVYEVIGWRLRRSDTALVVRNRPPDHWYGAEAKLSQQWMNEGKLRAAQYWFQNELPRVSTLADIIAAGDDAFLALPDAGF